MKLFADVRAACIDQIVAVCSGFMYGPRYRHYRAYVNRRKQGAGFPSLVSRTGQTITAIIGVVASRVVLQVLSVLPPRHGEKLFLSIMTLKKRRQELP